jgi:hypothetical protein
MEEEQAFLDGFLSFQPIQAKKKDSEFFILVKWVGEIGQFFTFRGLASSLHTQNEILYS